MDLNGRTKMDHDLKICAKINHIFISGLAMFLSLNGFCFKCKIESKSAFLEGVGGSKSEKEKQSSLSLSALLCLHLRVSSPLSTLSACGRSLGSLAQLLIPTTPHDTRRPTSRTREKGKESRRAERAKEIDTAAAGLTDRTLTRAVQQRAA